MIEAQEVYYAYTGNGVTTQFAYGCRIFAAADLVVKVGGVTKALGVDYTISGVDAIGGGEVTFVPAAIPANAAPVELERVLDYKRETSYVQNGGFQPEIVDKDQDYQTALLQQMKAQSVIVPANKLERADKLLAFDGDGSAILVDSAYTVVVSAGVAGVPTVIYADASSGAVNVDLPESGEVIVIKTDDTASPVSIVATGGKTILRQAAIDLTVQDETIRLVMNGTNWYRI